MKVETLLDGLVGPDMAGGKQPKPRTRRLRGFPREEAPTRHFPAFTLQLLDQGSLLTALTRSDEQPRRLGYDVKQTILHEEMNRAGDFAIDRVRAGLVGDERHS